MPLFIGNRTEISAVGLEWVLARPDRRLGVDGTEHTCSSSTAAVLSLTMSTTHRRTEPDHVDVGLRDELVRMRVRSALRLCAYGTERHQLELGG